MDQRVRRPQVRVERGAVCAVARHAGTRHQLQRCDWRGRDRDDHHDGEWDRYDVQYARRWWRRAGPERRRQPRKAPGPMARRPAVWETRLRRAATVRRRHPPPHPGRWWWRGQRRGSADGGVATSPGGNGGAGGASNSPGGTGVARGGGGGGGRSTNTTDRAGATAQPGARRWTGFRPAPLCCLVWGSDVCSFLVQSDRRGTAGDNSSWSMRVGCFVGCSLGSSRG